MESVKKVTKAYYVLLSMSNIATTSLFDGIVSIDIFPGIGFTAMIVITADTEAECNRLLYQLPSMKCMPRDFSIEKIRQSGILN